MSIQDVCSAAGFMAAVYIHVHCVFALKMFVFLNMASGVSISLIMCEPRRFVHVKLFSLLLEPRCSDIAGFWWVNPTVRGGEDC